MKYRVTALLLPLLASSAVSAFSQTATVKHNSNLRKSATTSSAILEEIAADSKVILISKTKRSGYYHVRAGDDKVGWILAKNVAISAAAEGGLGAAGPVVAQAFDPGCTLPFESIKEKHPIIDDSCGIDGSDKNHATPKKAKLAENHAKNNFCLVGPPIDISYANLIELQKARANVHDRDLPDEETRKSKLAQVLTVGDHKIDYDGAEYDKSTPLLWIAAAEGAALAVPHLIESNQRETVLRHYEYVQEILKEYHPTNSGGWNLLPSQKNPNEHHLYSTTLALLALLQAHQANLPWEGSVERRDQLIRQTAQWLVGGFDPTGDPPGWRGGIAEDTKEIYDGLTVQIFAELLQTQKALPDFSIPPAILQEIPRQLALFAWRDLSHPLTGGEFATQYTGFDGKEETGRESIKYLWYPRVIDCSVSWLEFAGKHQLPKEERVRVRRALGHLVVDLGDKVLKDAQLEYTFFASEDLYGLTAISP